MGDPIDGKKKIPEMSMIERSNASIAMRASGK